MLFIFSFRLIFCNAVSKEGCDKKESVKQQSEIIFFKQPIEWLVSFYCLLRYLKIEIILRNGDSGGWHLQIQQLVQAFPWRQSKESVESHLLKDFADFVSYQEK